MLFFLEIFQFAKKFWFVIFRSALFIKKQLKYSARYQFKLQPIYCKYVESVRNLLLIDITYSAVLC